MQVSIDYIYIYIVRQQAKPFFCVLYLQAAIDDIEKGTEELISSVATHLEWDIRKRVELDPTIEDKYSVNYHTNLAIRYLHNPFNNIKSRYKQKKFMRSNWSYVEAAPMVLGSHVEERVKSNQPTLQEVDDLYFHIPMMDSIKQFLSHEQVFNMVTSAKSHAPEGFYIDFWDGSVYKNHRMLSKMDDTDEEDEIVLGIQLYYDDLEVCNPLGGNTHNIAMFYYRLANVDPLYRSMLPAMRLVGVTETKYLKEYGIDNILEYIVADLRVLHDVSTIRRYCLMRNTYHIYFRHILPYGMRQFHLHLANKA